MIEELMAEKIYDHVEHLESDTDYCLIEIMSIMLSEQDEFHHNDSVGG